jgi:hypothetical protein
MTPLEWKRCIVEMVHVHQRIHELDTERVWEHHLPELAATQDELDQAEAHLGEPLDAHYRQFLDLAGGWRALYQMVDLFGPDDLLGGPRFQLARTRLLDLEDSVLVQSGYGREQLLPIACSRDNLDLFVIVRPSAPEPGTVVWFNGYEIDRYPTFDDYFLAMVEYGRREVEFLKTGVWPPT